MPGQPATPQQFLFLNISITIRTVGWPQDGVFFSAERELQGGRHRRNSPYGTFQLLSRPLSSPGVTHASYCRLMAPPPVRTPDAACWPSAIYLSTARNTCLFISNSGDRLLERFSVGRTTVSPGYIPQALILPVL